MLMAAGDAESGAILSPYNGQVKLIRSMMQRSRFADKVRPAFKSACSGPSGQHRDSTAGAYRHSYTRVSI